MPDGVELSRNSWSTDLHLADRRSPTFGTPTIRSVHRYHYSDNAYPPAAICSTSTPARARTCPSPGVSCVQRPPAATTYRLESRCDSRFRGDVSSIGDDVELERVAPRLLEIVRGARLWVSLPWFGRS